MPKIVYIACCTFLLCSCSSEQSTSLISDHGEATQATFKLKKINQTKEQVYTTQGRDILEVWQQMESNSSNE